MFDTVIIGKGPAGVSSAIYTARAGLKTMIIGKGYGALKKADAVENYYGFPDVLSGKKLVENGIAQAMRLGVEVITDEITSIDYDGNYLVKSSDNAYKAKSVIMATGSPRNRPKIMGLDDFEGRGVSYCATCDAFFNRGKNIAVVGCCNYALSEVQELLPVVASVTLLTDNEPHIKDFPDTVKIITKKIKKVLGDERLDKVVFEDGSSIDTDGLFVAVGVAGSTDLAKKLGAEIDVRRIITAKDMSTNIPGLYAAGDCTGGMMQIAKAVYEGAVAGTSVVKYLRTLKK